MLYVIGRWPRVLIDVTNGCLIDGLFTVNVWYYLAIVLGISSR
jgi:hypothetical protein